MYVILICESIQYFGFSYVHILCDNIATVYLIDKCICHVPVLLPLADLVFKNYKYNFKISYVPSEENKADGPSRGAADVLPRPIRDRIVASLIGKGRWPRLTSRLVVR